MSSFPTGPTSTTRSSTSSSSPRETPAPLALIACGALAGLVRRIADDRGWDVRVHALPASLHNRPDQIAPAAERLARDLRARGHRVALGYADCGSYGALDEVCERLGLMRLAGLHCYDVLGGADRVATLLDHEPGTYLLTDYLVRSFDKTVVAGLGLDRHPELWPDYFGHYRRLAWLAQEREPDLERKARAVAARFGLPLQVIEVGAAGLARQLEQLIHSA
jgi:hypothetical protein